MKEAMMNRQTITLSPSAYWNARRLDNPEQPAVDMIGGMYLTLISVLVTALWTSTGLAGPNQIHEPHPDQADAVYQAEHAVDHAWEVYHGAALGGTIASPALQVKIEQHLHDARTLVIEAQEAAERGDRRRLKQLVRRINIHTAHAIEGSKERKK
jgi:hypothetical protein